MILIIKGLEKDIKIRVRMLIIRAIVNTTSAIYKGSYNKAYAIIIYYLCCSCYLYYLYYLSAKQSCLVASLIT